jgi:hypothetical protein
MTQSITPSPELVQQWASEWMRSEDSRNLIDGRDSFMAARAAQWGSDQELEACCEYVYERLKLTTAACIAQELRVARRPNPMSLKEQALQALSEAVKMADDVPPEGICSGQADIIRRALEQIDD